MRFSSRIVISIHDMRGSLTPLSYKTWTKFPIPFCLKASKRPPYPSYSAPVINESVVERMRTFLYVQLHDEVGCYSWMFWMLETDVSKLFQILQMIATRLWIHQSHQQRKRFIKLDPGNIWPFVHGRNGFNNLERKEILSYFESIIKPIIQKPGQVLFANHTGNRW